MKRQHGQAARFFSSTQKRLTQSSVPKSFQSMVRLAAYNGSNAAKFHRQLKADEIEDWYSQMAQGRGTVAALLGAFYFGLSKTILETLSDSSFLFWGRWFGSVSQQHLSDAFHWLSPHARRALFDSFVWEDEPSYDDVYDPTYSESWGKCCRGAISSARVVSAFMRQGHEVHYSTTLQDIYSRIDLFCDIGRGQKICIQVKTEDSPPFDAWVLMDNPVTNPIRLNYLLPSKQFEGMRMFWHRVQEFNARENENMIPVWIQVGMHEVPLTHVQRAPYIDEGVAAIVSACRDL